MEMLKLVSYLEVLNKKTNSLSGDLLASKSNNKLLIGPAITKGFCFCCFKKRLLSSEFIDIIPYEEIDKQDRRKINKFLKNHKIDNNIILEVKENKVIKKHKLIKVPGCSC